MCFLPTKLLLFFVSFFFFFSFMLQKSRSIRDFDHHATCLVGKFEVLASWLTFLYLLFCPYLLLFTKSILFSQTVDTYYRRCSSASYVGNVSVPLLCINAFDDPVCTREAIPWDECRWIRLLICNWILYSSFFSYDISVFIRANKNIVLATVKHGGHLAFFEGITAASLWYLILTLCTM